MEAGHDSVRAIFEKALESIRGLKERNVQLSTALEGASRKLASCETRLAANSRLEEENRRLVSELETTRDQLLSLKGAVGDTVTGIREETRHLVKKLEAAYKIVELYELLYATGAKSERSNDEAVAEWSSPNELDLASMHERLTQALGWPLKETAQPVKQSGPQNKDAGRDVGANDLERQLNDLRAAMADRQAGQKASAETFAEEVRHFDETVVPFASRPHRRIEEEARPEPPVAALPRELPQEPRQRGAIDLWVSPISSFDTINKLMADLRSLAGVVKVSAKLFQTGTVRLSVDYKGAVALQDRLSDLPRFKLSVDRVSPEGIEATLEFGESSALDASIAR